ncbi:mercuric transporter MerT family protein [Alteromonas lipotrueiana]|uniref:mercuric transporter MerT family protein n=1 Tax=Alteromonas lipotrueiana TaxID=2803815 RepID=UPI001C46F885|nr:mercuric transporter MerT family protein [Alteromonas lipotrueiana]
MNTNKSALSMLSAISAAIGASLCCAGPLVLLLLGVSGSWISTLTVFAPYQPFFILITVLLLSYAGWSVYQKEEVCEADSRCAQPKTMRRRKALFWITTAIVAVLITSQYWLVRLV